MKVSRIGAACLALALLQGGIALADDTAPPQPQSRNWHVTLSAKGWYDTWTDWQTYCTDPSGTCGSVGTTSNTASNKMTFIGGITVRYKRLFVNGNISPATSFYFADIGQTFKRSESDFNVGYYIHPQVAFAMGIKNLKMIFGPGSVWGYRFVTLGINAAAPIVGTHFFLYGNGAHSITGEMTSYYVPSGFDYQTPVYSSIEAGIGYAGSSKIVYSLGYKYQQALFPIKDQATGILETAPDTTTGFIFGAAYTF